jgi:organic hydroperoxide reductase OsmC/OhrA
MKMHKLHQYQSALKWVGNKGTGTSEYKAYDRDHDITVNGKEVIHGSSDPSFRGNKSRYNPEEMLVMSLSSCHMLWYLHIACVNGVVVTAYVDNAIGVMEENEDGSGQFREVTLRPKVTVREKSMIEKANSLHHEANRMCFIARSVNFPVNHSPEAVSET